jgi:hypothetical protein
VVCLSNGAGFLKLVSVLDSVPDRLLMMLLDGHGSQVPHQELSATDAVLRNRECHCQWAGYVEVSWVLTAGFTLLLTIAVRLFFGFLRTSKMTTRITLRFRKPLRLIV